MYSQWSSNFKCFQVVDPEVLNKKRLEEKEISAQNRIRRVCTLSCLFQKKNTFFLIFYFICAF